MIDPPSWTAPQSLRNDGTQCRKRCCICLCSCLFVFCLLLYVLTILMIAVKLLPFGVSPLILFGLGALREQGGVCPGSASAYRLEEAWIGGGDHSFFDLDTWDYWYGGVDPTGGPTEYVDHATAMANGLLEEGDGWAVIRVGQPVRPETNTMVPGAFQWVEGPQLRQSVRMTTKKSWRHFLLSVQYTHMPYGCGLWPALWFWCADVEPREGESEARCPAWPAGGELDVIEYSNVFYTKSSFHIGADEVCTLDADAMAACGNFIDKNTEQFHCETDYFPANGDFEWGCAPNQFESWPTAMYLNANPGAIVVEWTEEAIKIWHFPLAQIPPDLLADDPKPASWNSTRLWSYFPFGNADCPGKDTIGAQNLVLNIATCGQWAGSNWRQAFDNSKAPTLQGMLANTLIGESCATRFGMNGHQTPEDACTAHVIDPTASAELEETGFFNLTHIKIFVPDRE